jgi:DMSO/TMAO reductase YedYZ molybdopterin-dependent catalytic subunit
MRRLTTQLVVAAIITFALVLTALSGLVLYIPGRLLPIFGISLLTWRAVHEWSALVLTAAVVVHVVVNRRRVGEMLARLARPSAAPQTDAAAVPSRQRDPEPPLGGQVATAEQPARLRLSRRWFLLLGAGAAAVVIAGLDLAHKRPHSSGSGPASLLEDFPVLNVESGPPRVAAASWLVTVDGLVDSPQRLDRSAWLALPRARETRDFHCVEGWSVNRLGWEGVRVADLLALAKPQTAGQFVTFHAYGPAYTDSLTLAEAQAPETLLADSLDGAALPPAHGGPLRLVIPSQLGYKNVKWVVRLEVTSTRAQGYWEQNGDYPAEAPVA